MPLYKGLILIVFSCLCHVSGLSQTVNNDMTEAIELQIDKPFNSKTDGNTVQYACIDQQLTGKCIQYHNDQWFTFSNTNFETLYINIGSQQCRDLRGVQLVAFEGELCSPDTYRILDCISLATQDDIYTTIGPLKPNQQYWLNIDGYLHDYCQFKIEVSPTPKGVSVKAVDVLKKVGGQKKKNVVQLNWSINDSLAQLLQNFIIMRRNEAAFVFDSLDQVPVEFNAFGAYQPDYSFTDQLYEPGTYWYRIIAQNAQGQKFLTEELLFQINSIDLSKAILFLDYEENDDIVISVYNEKDELLETINLRYRSREHRNFTLYIDKYKKDATKELRIVLYNKDNDHTKEMLIRIN